MAWSIPKTFNTGDVLPASDLNTHLRDQLVFLHDKGADVVAANTISTLTSQYHKITGSTQINNITAMAAGARIVLWFTGTPVLKHLNGGGGQLHLGGSDMTATVDEQFMFISDGTDWYLLNRSGSALTMQQSSMGADVTMTNANQYYDGPSIALGAGVWKCDATVTIVRGGSANKITGKLWDGTTVMSSAEFEGGASGDPNSISLVGVITLASSGTVKVSVAGTAGGNTIKAAAPDNAAGNTASTIAAVKA